PPDRLIPEPPLRRVVVDRRPAILRVSRHQCSSANRPTSSTRDFCSSGVSEPSREIASVILRQASARETPLIRPNLSSMSSSTSSIVMAPCPFFLPPPPFV